MSDYAYSYNYSDRINDMVDWAQVFQINLSAGGVPKRSVARAEVLQTGIRGDIQKDTEHHGGPDKAICLFPLEHIKALQGEGHPIFPGSVGENITVAGLDWSMVVPGMQLALGDQVVIEITSYTVPCRTIQNYFAGKAYGRISQKSHPGWSRVYARVLQPGIVVAGDRIMIVRPD